MCLQWLVQKEVTRFFFGGRDTIYRKNVVKVTPEECKRTITYPQQCDRQQMQLDKGTYKYIAQPVGDGVWLTSQRYTLLNCISQEITLRKDCYSCPIHSPLGILANDSSTVDHAIHNDMTIIWDKHDANPTTCNTNLIYSNVALMTTSKEGDARIVDKIGQLEFMFRTKKKVETCLNNDTYKVYGLEDTFISFTPIEEGRYKREIDDEDERINIRPRSNHPIDHVPVLFYGQIKTMANKNYCLSTYEGRFRVNWCFIDSQRRNETLTAMHNQDFAYLENGMLASNDGRKHCANRTKLIFCYHTKTFEPKDSLWDYTDYQLRFRENNLCLTNTLNSTPTNHELTLEPCVDGNTEQTWIFEQKVLGPQRTLSDFPLEIGETESVTPNVTRVDKSRQFIHNLARNVSGETAEKLMAEHKIFLNHELERHVNILAEEMKDIFCLASETQRNQAFLLAQTNGLLAARALDMPQCDRIESSGMSLILQRCTTHLINITVNETRCGPQPLYVNEQNRSFTIGKDGWSLHPFSECFWNGQFVNLNGNTYSYVNGEWKRQIPNMHIHKIKIVNRFKDIPVNDFDFAIRHHESYDTHDIEQSNVISELMSQMQESNVNSISDLVMNVQTQSHVWTASNWIQYIKYGLLSIAAIIVLGIIVKIIMIFKFTLGRFFAGIIPRSTKRRKEEREQSTPMLPILSSAPAIERPTDHDHSDTLFLPGKGLFWKDMCPIQPV